MPESAIYVEDIPRTAERLRLRPADAGGNVVLAEPATRRIRYRLRHGSSRGFPRAEPLTKPSVPRPPRGDDPYPHLGDLGDSRLRVPVKSAVATLLATFVSVVVVPPPVAPANRPVPPVTVNGPAT